MSKRRTRLLAAALLLVGPTAGMASSVTACGPAICYQYDNAQPALALFGTPTLIGDALRFLPTGELAKGGNSGAKITTATFVLDRVYTVGDAELTSVAVREFGDYKLQGAGAVTADLYLLVTSNATVEFAVDTDSFVAPIASVSPTGGPARVNGLGWERHKGKGGKSDVGSGRLGLWTLDAAIDPSNIFAWPANDVAVSIQDTLTALGRGSFIQKKAGFLVTAAVVPAPAVGWLLLPGIVALGRLGRKNRD